MRRTERTEPEKIILASLPNLILAWVIRSILATIVVDETDLVENSLKNGTLSLVLLYMRVLNGIDDTDIAEMPNI